MVFLDWCSVNSTCGGAREGATAWAPLSTGYEVELCVTCRGMGGAVGYHTSMLVNGKEYYFSTSGIGTSERLISHGRRARPERILYGFSKRSGAEMVEFLRKYFTPGTYDILHKNCNSFTDSALFFLTGHRLAWNFSAAERVGRVADDGVGLVQAISGGSYVPNPKAYGFDVEVVIRAAKAHLGLTAESEGESDSDSSDGGDVEVDWECSTTGSDPEPERVKMAPQARPAGRSAPWRQAAQSSATGSAMATQDARWEVPQRRSDAYVGGCAGQSRSTRLPVVSHTRDPIWL